MPALAVWTEDGVALYVPREPYKFIQLIDFPVDESKWTPIADVLVSK